MARQRSFDSSCIINGGGGGVTMGSGLSWSDEIGEEDGSKTDDFWEARVMRAQTRLVGTPLRTLLYFTCFLEYRSMAGPPILTLPIHASIYPKMTLPITKKSF